MTQETISRFLSYKNSKTIAANRDVTHKRELATLFTNGDIHKYVSIPYGFESARQNAQFFNYSFPGIC